MTASNRRRAQSRRGVGRMVAAVALVTVLALALPAAPAQAGLFTRCQLFIRDLRVRYNPPLANTAQDVAVADTTNWTMHIEFGRLLGQGWQGSVYEVKNVTGNPRVDVLLSQPDAEVVAKIPHAGKPENGETGNPTELAQRKMQDELDFFSVLAGRAKLVGPIDGAYWAEGRAPIVQILESLDTDYGLMLFKPKLKGTSLTDLVNQYGRNGLPQAMKDGLGVLRNWVYAVEGRPLKGGAPSRVPNDALRLDANSENMYWVDDPRTMALTGLTRPGFIMIEVSKLNGAKPKAWPVFDPIRDWLFFSGATPP